MVPDTPGPPPPPPPAPVMPPPAARRPIAPPGVAAVVNGVRITRAQVASEALKVAGPQIVNQLILIELINQEAKKQGVVITPAQVDARLQQLRDQYAQRVPGGLESLLTQRHQTLASYKQQLGTELKVEALIAKKTAATPGPLKYHARHLLILTSSTTPAMAPGAKPPHTDADALAIIKQAQADLAAGKSFESVAEKYTEDPSGKGKGGDLGLIDKNTPFDQHFLAAALALKPGEVTATPVKSSFGYHLIKIDSTSAAPTPADAKLYADAAEADQRQRVQQAIPAYVQDLRARAKIIDYLSDPTPPLPGASGRPTFGIRPGTPPRPTPSPTPAP